VSRAARSATSAASASASSRAEAGGAASARAEAESAAPEAPPAEAPMIRTIAMPADTNPAGDIFGGWLMAQMDLAAGNAAARRARGRCATVAVEAITFLSPVRVGDEVSLYARILSTGRTSLRVRVEAWRREREGDHTNRVTEAVFTFVALDSIGRPRPVPAA
jgi:acyl-CoA thioesterase YciA